MLSGHGFVRDTRKKSIAALDEYEVNAIVIDKTLVYLDFNQDALSRRPYFKTGWGLVPGSFYYLGIPELMKSAQQMCNAAVRSLVNNMGLASGPQVVLEDINRLAPGENILQMYAWKIWQFVNTSRSALKAISFFQPKSNAGELLGVFDRFASLSDDLTGIPAYTYGNDRVAGAGRTLGGLSMLMGAASRGIKKVIARTDQDIVEPALMRLYQWNMQHMADETIKGDAQIQPEGALSLIVREQMASLRMDFLSATGNPLDAQIMGLTGRANVLREATAALQMDSEKIVPGEEKLMAREAIAQQQQIAQAQQQQVMQAASAEQTIAKARADEAKAAQTATGGQQ